MPLFASADLLVPVPMHRWRLARRRFNQWAELARPLSRLTGLPMPVQALERHGATAQQVGLTLAGRRSNLRGAFRGRGAEKAGLAGRHILLVDDVLTTGATVEACTRTLLRAEAVEAARGRVLMARGVETLASVEGGGVQYELHYEEMQRAPAHKLRAMLNLILFPTPREVTRLLGPLKKTPCLPVRPLNFLFSRNKRFHENNMKLKGLL